MTEIIKVDPKRIDKKLISSLGDALRKGKTVVFPTETVYGLGANALDSRAVKKIFVAKGRPSDNPLIVHISSKKQLSLLAREIPAKAEKLMKAFWLGPLTLIFWKTKQVPSIVTAGLPKVAVRMPSHPIAHLLIKEAGVPIAAPSANISGKVSPTHPEDVIDDLKGRVDVIIDGGPTSEGIESTVLDMTTKVPLLLRPGTITKEQIEKEIGTIEIHPSLISAEHVKTPASPGMKYRHYAPQTELVLVGTDRLSTAIKQMRGKKIGLITTYTEEEFSVEERVHLGKNKKIIAKKIFRTLRLLDKNQLDVIVVEAIDEKGIGLGIMNRLKKAETSVF